MRPDSLRRPDQGPLLRSPAVAKCGSIGKALEWLRAKRRTPQEAKAMKDRKARSRNRDHVYRSRMAYAERENDSLAKRIRQLEERNRVLEAAATFGKA